MERPTCKTCPYWRQITEANLYGECRRFPATAIHPMDVGSPPGTVSINFPSWTEPDEDDWCGEHPDFPAYLASLKEAR